jgi:hypothetical protein
MANPTTNFGWVMPTSTDLVTDLPADFAVFGQAVDTSMADLKGGTTGQILSKATNADMDFTWVTNDVGDITAVTAGTGISGGGTSGAVTITNDMATTITTNGDLIYGTGSGTYTRRGIGSTGQILTVTGGVPTWSTPASTSPTFVGAIAYGAVNLAWNNTATAVSSLTSEVIDTDGFHSTSSNTSRMTIPTGKDGTYLMGMDMNLAATGGSSPNMYLMAYKNGAAITEGIVNGKVSSFLSAQGQDAHWNASLVVTGVATDYFEFFVIMGGGSSTIDKARYSFTYLGA